MNEQFEILVNKLKEYEGEINRLWALYNPNDNCLKMELLWLKLTECYYKYIIACFDMLNEISKEKILNKTKACLTMLSYGLTGLSAIKAPIITIPALISSICLSVRRREERNNTLQLTPDQINEVLDILDNFENTYTNQIDSISEQVDIFEDDAVIESLDEEEKHKRIACKNLMQFLRSERPDLQTYDSKMLDDIKDIIKDSIETDSNDVYSLIQEAIDTYNGLNDNVNKLERKNNYLSKIYHITQ